MVAVYKYKAIDNTGRPIEAEFHANTKDEVLSMLREKGYTPVKIELQEQKSKT